jgi:hypothetical protein
MAEPKIGGSVDDGIYLRGSERLTSTRFQRHPASPLLKKGLLLVLPDEFEVVV